MAGARDRIVPVRMIFSAAILLLSASLVAAKSEITTITLERTPCFGACPVYKLPFIAPARSSTKEQITCGRKAVAPAGSPPKISTSW